MNEEHRLENFLDVSADDPRIGPAHLSVYLALLYCRSRQRSGDPFAIRAAEIMKTSRIHARTTYNKIMKELNLYGYIRYKPSRYPLKQSMVHLPSLLHG